MHDSAAAMCHPRSTSSRPTICFDRFSTHAVRIVAKARGCVRSRLREERLRLRFGRRVHGNVQVDRAARGQDRRFHRPWRPRPLGIQRAHGFLRMRLAAAEHTHHPRVEPRAGASPFEPLTHGPVEHRNQLAWRPGQQHEDLVAGFDVQAGRGAVGIRQHGSAARHHRLPPVDLRHRHAAPPEALAYRVADRQRPPTVATPAMTPPRRA